MSSKSILVLGAASPLGITVLSQLAKTEGINTIAADLSSKYQFLLRYKSQLGSAADRVTVAILDPFLEYFGFEQTLLDQIEETTTHIYHFAHTRNRTIAASTIGQRNRAICDKALALAHITQNLEALVVVTDVGLVGDFPGQFSESWVDVGQVPFDEVDRSSIEVESNCLKETDLPIVRARVGLLSDLREEPDLDVPWRSAAEVLFPSIRYLKKISRYIKLPSAVAKNSLAPLTPTEWAAETIVYLSRDTQANGQAFHLVIHPPPTIEEVLMTVSKQGGGARLSGGLPISVLDRLGVIPGLKETVRRHTDHLASWWTPHRYCLSRNEFNTFNSETSLPESLSCPSWSEMKRSFFHWA